MHGKLKSFHVLNMQHTCIFVQERLLEIGCLRFLFRDCGWLHQLESLILAQNERWRHA